MFEDLGEQLSGIVKMSMMAIKTNTRTKGPRSAISLHHAQYILFVYLFSRVSAYPNLQVAGNVYLKLYLESKTMKLISLKPASLLLLAAALGTPLTASAQSGGHIQEVHQRAITYVRQKDPSSRELQFKVLRMRGDQEITLPINLRAGKVYSFVSTCEEGCDGLILSLNDSYDIRVGLDDVFERRINAFSYKAEQSGRHVIHIGLQKCTDRSGCEVSLNVHEGSKGVFVNFRQDAATRALWQNY